MAGGYPFKRRSGSGSGSGCECCKGVVVECCEGLGVPRTLYATFTATDSLGNPVDPGSHGCPCLHGVVLTFTYDEIFGSWLGTLTSPCDAFGQEWRLRFVCGLTAGQWTLTDDGANLADCTIASSGATAAAEQCRPFLWTAVTLYGQRAPCACSGGIGSYFRITITE